MSEFHPPADNPLSGDCETCGEWWDGLIAGMCPECRERYHAEEYRVPRDESAWNSRARREAILDVMLFGFPVVERKINADKIWIDEYEYLPENPEAGKPGC